MEQNLPKLGLVFTRFLPNIGQKKTLEKNQLFGPCVDSPNFVEGLTSYEQLLFATDSLIAEISAIGTDYEPLFFQVRKRIYVKKRRP